MIVALSTVASHLGWTTATAQVGEAVHDTLLAYGVSDIAQATDIEKLRALARWKAWAVAVDALSMGYDFESDAQAYKRSQMHAQAEKALQRAEAEAIPYAAAMAVAVDKVIHLHDPYGYLPDDVRVVP
jgi:hypothetical protein